MDLLSKCEANYTPLSPVDFLPRAAAVYADRTSVVYGGTRFTWKQTYDRCRRLASSLTSLNVCKKDVVSVLAPNVPALYEMNFAVPMAGAVLNAINTRLDAGNVAAILRHAEPRVFFVDYEYVPLAIEALKLLVGMARETLLVVVIDDVDAPTGVLLGDMEYEKLIARGDPAQPPEELADEWDPIALNYTSGTTSAPKGVVYSHRGAYLSTLSLLLQWEVGSEPVYLWSLPMFHCNGWTFTWGMAARGGANICIRAPTAASIYASIADHNVTHMCCAPTLFSILLEAESSPLRRRVNVLTGGAAPPPALLEQVESMGFNVTHAYGSTEATGPALVCEWRAQWDVKSPVERAALKARQGISVLSLADVDVMNPTTMQSVPRDGKTAGEIVLRGSSVMKGYYKNVKDTSKALNGGWFWTGDVGVVHRDGYLEIKDRSKDVIISGGENISSVEVEGWLYHHPAVAEAAVVAMPHPRWGESPCAFVVLKKSCEASEEEVIAYCRSKMAGFMAPKKVVFVEEIPRMNGKVKKYELREAARRLSPASEGRRLPQNAAAPALAALGCGHCKGNNGHAQEQVLAVSRL